MTTTTPNAKAPRKTAKRPKTKTSPDVAAKTPPSGRDPSGRFLKGNVGGIGNPYARQVAILRREVMQTTSPEVIRRLALKLQELGMSGNVQAIKLLFAYSLGQPTQPVSPDDVDMHEVLLFHKEANIAFTNNPKIKHWDGCDNLLAMLRLNRARNAYKVARAAAGSITATRADKRHHAIVTAHLSPREQFLAWGNYAAAKDYPPMHQSEFRVVPWVPWPDADQAPSTNAPSGVHGAQPVAPTTSGTAPVTHAAPSRSGANGAHPPAPAPSTNGAPSTDGAPSKNGVKGAPPKASHENAKGRKPETNGAVNRLKGKTPSSNGVIGARSKYALMPKCMRPKGVIVPGF